MSNFNLTIKGINNGSDICVQSNKTSPKDALVHAIYKAFVGREHSISIRYANSSYKEKVNIISKSIVKMHSQNMINDYFIRGYSFATVHCNTNNRDTVYAVSSW